jgi:hypothetical protein
MTALVEIKSPTLRPTFLAVGANNYATPAFQE